MGERLVWAVERVRLAELGLVVDERRLLLDGEHGRACHALLGVRGVVARGGGGRKVVLVRERRSSTLLVQSQSFSVVFGDENWRACQSEVGV